MAWLVAVAIFVVAYLFVAGYRKAAAGVAAVAVIVGVAIYLYVERKEEREVSRIAVSEIAVRDVALKPTFRSSYDLTGTVTNNSPSYRLDGIEVAVTLRDCTGAGRSSCTVIGEAGGNAVLAVEPGGSSPFIVSLHFGGDRPKAKGRLEWDYVVTAAAARRQ